MSKLLAILLAVIVTYGVALGQTVPPENNGADLLAAAEKSGRADHYAAAEAILSAAYHSGDHRPQTVRDLATVYGRTGKIEDAAQLLIAAQKREPRAASLHDKLGYLYRYAGLPETSIAEYRRTQELANDVPSLVASEGQIAKAQIYRGELGKARLAHRRVRDFAARGGILIDEKMLFYEGMVALYAGRRNDATALFDSSFALAPESLWSGFAQAYKAALLGRTGDVFAHAALLETGNVSDGERRYRLVHLYAMAGDRPRALAHLDGAIDAGFFNYPYIRRDPLTKELHAMPEFQSLIERARIRRARFCKLVTVAECKGIEE